jgi:hypothetical protein
MDEKPTTEKPLVSRLIDLQRRLIQSKSPFIRRLGALLGAGALDRQLSELRDKQVGQLMLDFVERDLGIVQPEATICHQATRRLFRSENGRLEEEPPLRPPCPECESEMLFHYGIDEPDYFECVYLGCNHKEYVDSDEPLRKGSSSK